MSNSKRFSRQGKNRQSRSLFYRLSAWLHLWLGLATGVIVVIVCLLACIYVFKDELTDYVLEPENHMENRSGKIVPPGYIYRTASSLFPGERVASARYQPGRVIKVNIGDSRKPTATIKMDPTTGNVIQVGNKESRSESFFRTILNGHRFLWLPYKIGRPLVNYSILIFTIILLSGIVLWWPKRWTKSTKDKSFKIKFGASPKRLNYDLHNVLGFYALLILFILACTGIVYGIDWFSKALYWTTSGGGVLPKSERYESDTLKMHPKLTVAASIDLAWKAVLKKNPDARGFYCSFPDSAKRASTINLTVYFSGRSTYENISYTFDQFSISQMPPHAVNGHSLKGASFAVKLRKMNYDIHVGSILGLPTKILAFLASLIGASLPITGFIIWFGKGEKNKKKAIKNKKQKIPQVQEH